jgi:hypothetical protein
MAVIVSFLITLAELAFVIGSALMQSHNIIYLALVYGSPLYLIMNMLNSDSMLLDSKPFFIIMFAFHIVKYFIIFRAQLRDDFTWLRWGSIVMEAAYLATSAYYNN